MEPDLNGYLLSDSLTQQISTFTIPSSPECESDRISEFLYGDQEDSLTDNSDYKNTTTMLPEQLAEEFNKNAKVASHYENMQQTSHFTVAYFQLFERITPQLTEPRKVPRVVPDVYMDDAGSSDSSIYMSDEDDHVGAPRTNNIRNNQVDSEESELEEEEEEENEEMDSQSPAVTAPSSPVLSVATSQASVQSLAHSQNEGSVQDSVTTTEPRIIEPTTSTVGTIPSNMSSVTLNHQPSNNSPLPATLALRPTLPYSARTIEYDKGTVFSGPHHLPEKYSIQPCMDYRKRHLIPDELYYQRIKPSRYFVSQVNPFFEASMGDASQYTSYNHYNPSDPVNFRHSYPLTMGQMGSPSRLDSIHSQQYQTIYGQSSTTPGLSPRGIPKRRRFKATENFEDSEGSQLDEEEDGGNVAMETDETSSQNNVEGKLVSIMSSLHGEQIGPVTAYKTSKFEQWLSDWKQSDPEACCICFSKKTTNNNVLVYCDNPFCEVIVHQKCYHIAVLPSQDDPWYCDRCNHKPSPSTITTTCPFCPSVKGAFCKLDFPIFGCEWAHLLCIKYAFEDLYCYNKLSNKYEILMDKVPLETFNTSCSLCSIKEFTGFGAKIKCQSCTKRYHVTCAAKRGLCWLSGNNRVHTLCLQHKSNIAFKESPYVVSKQWHDWVSQEEDVILELFGKSINGFILESWKGKTNIMSIPTGNSLYDNYRQFKTAIMSIKIPDKNVDFYHHVNRVLCNIQKKYITDLPEDKGKELKAKNDKISTSSSSDPSKKRLKLFVSKDAQSSESDSRRSSISEASTSSSTSDQMGTGKSNKYTMQDLAVGSISKNAHSGQSHKSKKRKSSLSEPSKSKKAKIQKKKSFSKKPISKSTSSHNENLLNNTTGTNETSTTSKPKPSTTSKLKPSTTSKPTPSSRRRPQEEIKPKECFICHQLELPDEVRIKLKLPENYQKKLEETKDKRRPGCTGYGDIWDPRVLIKCRDCNNFIHCGCPEIPITRYDPKKRGEAFICVQCDNPKEDDPLKYYNQPRTVKRINYKV